MGHVVGTLRRNPDSSGVDHPFYWQPDAPNAVSGTLSELPMLSTGRVRNYELGPFPETINHAVVWSAATDTLADIGEPQGTWDDIFATAINAHGQIVGYADVFFPPETAFLWTPFTPNGTTGVMQSLPGMGYALDINDAGTVVGYTIGSERAAIWTPTTGTVLLKELLAMPNEHTLRRAVAINNEGQVVIWGATVSQNAWVGLLLTPVPEPSTALLVALSLLFILSTRKFPR